MTSRTWFAICVVFCLIMMVASVAMAVDPLKIYEESRTGGSIYYIGQVAGDTCYTGQIWNAAGTGCAQQWGDQQIGGTALLNHTPDGFQATPPQSPTNIAKASLPLGGYIYLVNGGGGIYRTATWDCTGGMYPVSGLPVIAECICTDGNFIYMTSGTSASYMKVYKLAVDHVAGSVSVVSGWPVTVGDATVRFRGISYYGGKLYLANFLYSSGAGGQIWEMDANTGALTQLATNRTNAYNSHYQVVRYGDQLFLVGLDCNLYTYTYNPGSPASATLLSTAPTGYTYASPYGLFGIGVKGDGTTARYAWITAPGARMSFWDLTPYTGTATHFGDPMASSYKFYVDEAVVTASVDYVDPIDPSKSKRGFWVENKDRTTATFVAWTGDLPAQNTMVTIGAPAAAVGKTETGERTVTAAVVTPSGQYAVQPLFTTNKNLGPATGSAGLANDGMLVKVSGKVTGCHALEQAFYVDDGSGVANDTPNEQVPAALKGLKIGRLDGSGLWDVSWNFWDGTQGYATVVGIVRLEKAAGGTVIRRIDFASGADVVITPIP